MKKTKFNTGDFVKANMFLDIDGEEECSHIVCGVLSTLTVHERNSYERDYDIKPVTKTMYEITCAGDEDNLWSGLVYEDVILGQYKDLKTMEKYLAQANNKNSIVGEWIDVSKKMTPKKMTPKEMTPKEMVKYGDILITEDMLITRVNLDFNGDRTFINDKSEICFIENYSQDLSNGIDDGDPVINRIVRPSNIDLIRAPLPCLKDVLAEFFDDIDAERFSKDDYDNDGLVIMWERPEEEVFDVVLNGEKHKVNQFTLDEIRSLIQ